MEGPKTQLFISSDWTDGFLICDLQVRSRIKLIFFTCFLYVIAHPRESVEIREFSGLSHSFQGKICDLGRFYWDKRCELVTPIGETGVTQLAPVQQKEATQSLLFRVF